MDVDEIILKLYDVKGLKFGNFTMRTGVISPVYIDMRVIWSYPDLVKSVSEQIWKKVQEVKPKYDKVCGPPYQGIPLATYICTNYNVPMLLKRKNTKSYGTKQLIEGHYQKGDQLLLLDDVVMTGGALIEDINVFISEGLRVACAVAFFDRGQGGCEHVKQVHGVDVHCVVTLQEAFQVLLRAGRVSQDLVDNALTYLGSVRFDQQDDDTTSETADSEECGTEAKVRRTQTEEDL